MGTDGWGFIKFDAGKKDITQVNVKWYVLAQFTRHIRPGMFILDSDRADTVIAHDAESRTLTIATANFDGSQKSVTWDLTGFAEAKGPVLYWSTKTDGGDLYKRQPDMQLDQGSQGLTVNLGSLSMNTFEIQNVVRRPDAGQIFF